MKTFIALISVFMVSIAPALADPCQTTSDGAPLAGSSQLADLARIAADVKAPHGGADLSGGIDIQVGSLTGVEGSLVFFTHSRVSAQLEAFGGLAVLAPAYGGGARVEIKAVQGEKNSLVIAPGADIYHVPTIGSWFFSPFSTENLIVPNADIKWQHQYDGGKRAFELGVRAGYGIKLLSGQSPSEGPQGSLLLGWRFQ